MESLTGDMAEWDFDSAKETWNKNRASPFDFEQWCKEIDSHPAFMTTVPQSGEYSEPLEALQAMKYDAESSEEEQAAELKNDGNVHFKKKDYKKAIAAYTEGIKLRCKDKRVNAELYNNRSASQFYLGNFRSSFKDCFMARKFDPDHEKVFKRGIDCLTKLKCYKEIQRWIEQASEHLRATVSDLEQILHLCRQQIKDAEKNSRRECIRKMKEDEARCKLIKCFKERKVKFRHCSENQLDQLDLDELKVDIHRCSNQLAVHFNEESSSLVWPVLFLYPEHNTTDFVERFDENDSLFVHLVDMLSDTCDSKVKNGYTVNDIEVYYESYQHPETLIRVPLEATLREILSQDSYYVVRGIPSFIVLSAKTNFKATYMTRFTVNAM